jgi:hypothetical protein
LVTLEAGLASRQVAIAASSKRVYEEVVKEVVREKLRDELRDRLGDRML